MKKLIFLFLISVVMLGQTNSAIAQSKVSAEVIAERCQRAQNYASTDLKESDLRSRVDRLQAYLYIHQRLDLLAQRLEHNSQPGAKELKNSLAEYMEAVEGFKSAYESYDNTRNSLSQITDCSSKPDEFSKALAKMREQRKKVALAVRDVKTELKDLNTQLNTLVKQFEPRKEAS